MLKVPNALFLTKFRLINLLESLSNDNGDRPELHLQTKHRMDWDSATCITLRILQTTIEDSV